MYTIVMIFSEIKYYIKNEGEDGKVNGNPTSLSFSCILLILFLVLLILVFISWRKIKDKTKIDDSWKTKELYHGMRAVSKKCSDELRSNENDEAHKENNQRMEAYRQVVEENKAENEDENIDEG